MKIGFIIDSSSGISKKEADKKGWGFLPLYININDKEYADGIDISAKDFYEKININDKVRTSATPPGEIEKLFKIFSKKYDKVVVFGLSNALSSQTGNLTKFAEEFDNILVLDSEAIGYAIIKIIEKTENMLKDEKTFEEIMDFLNQSNKSIYGLALPATMKWLVKGGRVSPKAAAMANLISIIPIIKFQHGKLDKYGKGRVFEKSVVKAAKAFKKEVGNNANFIIYKGAIKNQDQIISKIKGILGDIEVKFFPPVVALHTGPEVIAFISYK